SIALSSTCSPVVLRSVATKAVVAAVPPTTSGPQPVKTKRPANAKGANRVGRKARGLLITRCLRVARRQCRRKVHVAIECEFPGYAWCDRAEHINDYLFLAAFRRFGPRLCR